jgi:hypothetical protein
MGRAIGLDSARAWNFPESFPTEMILNLFWFYQPDEFSKKDKVLLRNSNADPLFGDKGINVRDSSSGRAHRKIERGLKWQSRLRSRKAF